MPNDVGHGSRFSPGGQLPLLCGSKSLSVFWCQWLSSTACARTMLSESPHLHAPHWMITSVVPVKSPVTRGLYFAWNSALYAASSASFTGCVGFVLFAVVLSPRGSHRE